jgi:hypothetical protein
MSRLVDLFIAVLIACVALLLTLLMPDTLVLRAIIGVPFMLFVPGYAITAAAFPHAILGLPERVVLSLGLSLAVLITGSLILYLMLGGLNANSWAILLFAVTLVASLIATVHRVRNPGDIPARIHLGLRWYQLLFFGFAALLVVAAFDLALTPLPSQGIQGYTELWIVPAGNEQKNVVRLGINSMEFATTSYKLDVQARGQNIQEWSGIELTPGQKWETTMALPPAIAGQMVEAVIYRLDAPKEVYRRVEFWPSP